MTGSEFQAIVLAGGRGSRFEELLGGKPKCLIPIGPFPMIFYPIQMLQRHGFQEIIVIVLESEKLEIQQALERTTIKAKLDYATLPSNSEMGTAQALKHISDRIKWDSVIVSCDTVTNIDLHKMLNQFRQNNASIVAQLFKGGLDADTIVPGPKAKHKQDRDLIGIQPKTQRLTFLASTSDFEETLDLPYHLLRRYGEVVMQSQLIDSHIYIIKKWVFVYLNSANPIFSLKGELIPHIVKKQMSKLPPKTEIDKQNSQYHINTTDNIIDHFLANDGLTELDQKITDTSSFNESDNRNPFNGDMIHCFAVNPQENTFGIRVNTTLSYCTINQKIFSLWRELFPENAPAMVSTQCTNRSTQISNVAVADDTLISEKTSLKNCTLGTNCTINMKTRISNSVLMNGVIIEENVVIENCVICEKAIVRKGSVLKNCLVGPNHEVAENTNREKAHLTNSDGYMEIE